MCIYSKGIGQGRTATRRTQFVPRPHGVAVRLRSRRRQLTVLAASINFVGLHRRAHRTLPSPVRRLHAAFLLPATRPTLRRSGPQCPDVARPRRVSRWKPRRTCQGPEATNGGPAGGGGNSGHGPDCLKCDEHRRSLTRLVNSRDRYCVLRSIIIVQLLLMKICCVSLSNCSEIHWTETDVLFFVGKTAWIDVSLKRR